MNRPQYSKTDISDAIIKNCGVIAHAAHELGLNKDTLYEYIKRFPELWDVIDEQRRKGSQMTRAWLVDRALRNTQKIMEKADSHPSASLKACTYILDNMDDYHGCKKKQNSDEPVGHELKREEIFDAIRGQRTHVGNSSTIGNAH